MARPWSDEELERIRPRRTAAVIARETGRSESAVKSKAKALGVPLRGSKAARRRPAAKTTHEETRTPARPLLSVRGCASPELIAAFIGKHLKLVDGAFYGKPFVLEDFQIHDLIEPVFGTLDEDGDRVYSEALWGIPRDGGKSELSAALALAVMFLEPVMRGKYVVIAKSREQAGIVFEKAKFMVLNDPMLKAMCDVRSREIIVKATGQKFYTLPWDDAAAQGVHAQLVIIDEYHVHRNSSVYYAALSGQTHQPNSLLIAISTAAAERKGPLWDLITRIREETAEAVAAGILPTSYMHWIGAADDDDPTDPKVWKKANPQSWATEKSLRKAFKKMPLWEFERYHLNRFPQTGAFHQAFSLQIIEKNIAVPEIDPRRTVVIGIDAAPARDRCALVVAQRALDGLHHWRPYIWKPGRQMDLGDFEAIEQTVRDIAAEGLYIARIISDPAFVWLALNRLKAEGFPVETMRQDNAHMCNVAAMLQKLLSGGMVRFDDERVEGDLANCAVLERPPFGWRIGKLDDDGYIDSAIAGGMASFILETDPAFIAGAPPVIVG